MKNFKVITYIILMIAFSFSFSSCEKHDDIHYHSDCDIISIMVRANSPEDGTTYDGVISENGNITFELPAKVKLNLPGNDRVFLGAYSISDQLGTNTTSLFGT